ncbi:GTP pyrophosphokinase [bacterium J17]|nr:GTP pyrophosphokinase [bacterium J17]
MKLQDIIISVQEYLPNADVDSIRRAYAFVRATHQGQTRASGEPFINHVTEVAYLATKLKLDLPSILTALLHDTVEDTTTTLEQIETEFGKEISLLVDGVTKLSQVKFSSKAEAQAENFRKMLLAMAKDIRVLLIKLCDRTHNMRTLEFLSESRRSRIAQETLDIYAPLAHRLGIYWMKSELEDLALRYLKPGVYDNIKKHVKATRKERERYIAKVVKLISDELKINNIECDVSGRPKHFHSIYQKMEKQGLHFNEIHDLIGFRIIVSSTMDCYSALGVIHAGWKPIPGRFKDYIAMPKPNQYQSLHTTVIGPEGARIEIQIRTQEMHEIAERGIAAHWFYKEGSKNQPSLNALQFSWMRDLVESEESADDPFEFINNVKDDLTHEEVYVFSPKGDVIALPAGSTPIDYGYHIHSEVGHHCSSARINGKQVTLGYQLQNGDTVEIIDSKNQTPGKHWLNIAVTPKAKQKIRAWLKNEERARSIAVGKELLTKDLRKLKLNLSRVIKNGSLEEVAKDLGLKDHEILFAEVGYGKISSNQVLRKLRPEDDTLDEKLAKDDTALQKIFKKAAKAFRDKAGVKVHGMDDVVFRFAKCCEPLPGDEMIGYITRGRGVTIHRRDCAQALSFDPRRLVPVSWDENIKTIRTVTIKIYLMDQFGLLARLTKSISSVGANIVSAHVGATPDGKAVGTFDINVESSAQLDTVTRELEKLDGVIKVIRQRSQDESDNLG